jgi:hypothetical protein
MDIPKEGARFFRAPSHLFRHYPEKGNLPKGFGIVGYWLYFCGLKHI